MLNSTELGERILSILEEFSHENVFAMLNTILTPSGTLDELREYMTALTSLVRDGAVTIIIQNMKKGKFEEISQTEAKSLLGAIGELFEYDVHANRWAAKSRVSNASHIPVIKLTKDGMKEAVIILERRGYRWWV